jgi:hypothetical protein
VAGLVLLLDSLKEAHRLIPIALAAAAVAAVSCRFLPTGVALLIASVAALAALWNPAAAAEVDPR